MRILLVYPEHPDTYWSFKHVLSLMSKKTIYPPLGLLTVAAMLPSEYEKKLIDMNVTRLSDKDILWADYVFISAMLVQKPSVKEIINRCKKLNRKIVAGGPLFTTGYDDFTDVDHFVLGEAENTLAPFLSDLAAGRAKPIYTSEERPDISETPLPLWSLIKMEDYASMNIQYSRGCPFDCEFCDIVTLFGRKLRIKKTQQFISELDELYRLGWRGQVFIVDDNFIGNKKVLKAELLPAMVQWSEKNGHPFYFLTEVSIDLADDDELMQLMIEANFAQVFVGVETPNEESLDECNKIPNKNRDMISSIRKMQNRGLEVVGGFIVGFDNDPSSIFESQIDFIQKSGIVVAMVNLLNAPPGSRLYHRLKEENRLVSEGTGDTTDGSINFIPRMNYKTLITGYKNMLETLYSPVYYYRRIQKFYGEFRPHLKRTSNLEYVYVISLIKSIWVLGVADKARLHFWKTMFSTLFKYPQFFWLSISFLIYRRHFYILARKINSAVPDTLTS